MEKKAKAEAKLARRNQRKLELEAGANHPEDNQDVEVNSPGIHPINAEDSR